MAAFIGTPIQTELNRRGIDISNMLAEFGVGEDVAIDDPRVAQYLNARGVDVSNLMRDFGSAPQAGGATSLAAAQPAPAATSLAQIADLYQRYQGRAPGPGEAESWLPGGMSLADMERSFSANRAPTSREPMWIDSSSRGGLWNPETDEVRYDRYRGEAMVNGGYDPGPSQGFESKYSERDFNNINSEYWQNRYPPGTHWTTVFNENQGNPHILNQMRESGYFNKFQGFTESPEAGQFGPENLNPVKFLDSVVGNTHYANERSTQTNAIGMTSVLGAAAAGMLGAYGGGAGAAAGATEGAAAGGGAVGSTGAGAGVYGGLDAAAIGAGSEAGLYSAAGLEGAGLVGGGALATPAAAPVAPTPTPTPAPPPPPTPTPGLTLEQIAQGAGVAGTATQLAGGGDTATAPAAASSDPYGGSTAWPDDSVVDPNTGATVPHGGARPNTPAAAANATALSRLLANDGTATDADWASVLGTAGSTALGYLGSRDQTQSLERLSREYMAMGAPSRARYESSFDPGFKLEDMPGYQQTLDTSYDTMLRRLSTTGNPYGSPGGLAEAMKYITGNVGLPALQNYRSANANAGGLSRFADAAPGAATAAIGSEANTYNVIGAGVADLTRPRRRSLAELMQGLT